MAAKKKLLKPSRPEPKALPMCWGPGDSRGSYQFQTKSFRIIVHHHIDYHPDVWMVSCYEAGIQRRELNERTAAGAKLEAAILVRDRMRAMLADAEKVLASPIDIDR